MSDVVDRVLAALNARDLDGFIACYTADATIENGHDRVAARGHEELRSRYGKMFERHPELHVRPGWRSSVGDFVVQEETVTGRDGDERHIAVYLLEEGRIARERLFA
jgi:hypothetical protein